MRKVIPLMALCAALISCSKKQEGETAAPVRLERIVETLYNKQPCASVIPEHWSPSWPVPTGGGEFKLLYYPVERNGAGLQLSAPMGEAVFAAGDGAVSSCVRLPGAVQKPAGTIVSGKTPRHSPEEMRQRSKRLYALSEIVEKLFAAKSPPSPQDKLLMGEYARLFLELAEPPLLPYYYNLQPEFWDWLSAAGAPSIR